MKKKMVAVLLSMSVMVGSFSGCGAGATGTTECIDSSASSNQYIDEYKGYDVETGGENEVAVTETMDASVSNNMKADGISEDSVAIECEPSVNEEYKEIEEKGFQEVAEKPLSTFSADVDTASYSNLRRMIEDGYSMEEIPADAVRIEEMLNYFSYDYAKPKGEDPFGVTMEMAECPWNSEHDLLLLGLKTEEIDFSETGASNLVFLLDVSGSMSDPDKLPLLQQSFCMLCENLTEKDRVSIVTYAGSDEVVLEGARGNEWSKICDALNNLEAGGCTNGSEGIITAYELAEEYFVKGGNNRVILATDGDLNVGLTTESELEDLIAEKRQSGVFLSVLGFGTGNIKDNKMETLADCGNGNYAYIDSVKEAKKTLVEEMGATLVTVAKDVKFQVEFNPDYITSYRLLGYENRALADRDFADDTKDAGEIGAGHTVTALYEIETVEGAGSNSNIPLKYQKQKETTIDSDYAEWCTLKVRYKEPDGTESKLCEYPAGLEVYSTNPSDDWKFAAAVAEFGLLLRNSDYKGDASLRQVKSDLKNIDLKDDEYKVEFTELVKNIR